MSEFPPKPNPVDDWYQNLIHRILAKGVLQPNRTGTPAYTIPHATFEHRLSEGFPLLTTKKVHFGKIAAELEWFIKGITSKQWLQARGVTIWDEWANPKKVPYGHDVATKAAMLAEDDLGLIYGSQWRNFCDPDRPEAGVDQLRKMAETLKSNPADRRMIVSAWNPLALDHQGLPPCHYSFQISVIGDELHLIWNQRSVDLGLGLPYNIASYGLLLHLLAKEGGFKEGVLIGSLANVHIYQNHEEALRKQLDRASFDLPTVSTLNFTSIFDWEFADTDLLDYRHQAGISMKVAV